MKLAPAMAALIAFPLSGAPLAMIAADTAGNNIECCQRLVAQAAVTTAGNEKTSDDPFGGDGIDVDSFKDKKSSSVEPPKPDRDDTPYKDIDYSNMKQRLKAQERAIDEMLEKRDEEIKFLRENDSEGRMKEDRSKAISRWLEKNR